MEIKKLDLPEPSKLMDDYVHHFERLSAYFEYDYKNPEIYRERLNDIRKYDFQREALVEYLAAFNRKYGAPTNVLANIERLRDKRAVVVVGGQQAGLLTGPAYTIHKCLSIVQVARHLETTLGVPVIPVFWIAGEDHDFAEVNHVHVFEQGRIRKIDFRHPDAGQTSISRLVVDREQLSRWVEAVFQAYGETAHTRPLVDDLLRKAAQSDTLVAFFAQLLHDLFGDQGLVLLDSGDPALRRLEAPYFRKLIEQSEAICANVMEQLSLLKAEGYGSPLDQRPTSANLFYHNEQSERILLDRAESGAFANESKGVRISREELFALAETRPERLSNNVVTRPLMQEMLLPTVAFIGGPGEIAYWAALKGAFRAVGLVMPPVVPRKRITMIDRRTKRWLDEKAVAIREALTGGLSTRKEEWLRSQHDWDVDAIHQSVVEAVRTAYHPLGELAGAVSPALERIREKNWWLIEEQLNFMKKAIDRELRLRHATELSKFDRVEAALLPNRRPQERVWNIYYFINYWGRDLVDRLVALDLEPFDGCHAVVEL